MLRTFFNRYTQTRYRYMWAWICTGITGGALLLPFLVTEGLFLDGLVYATVARNMAQGSGDFFTPVFEANMHVPFYEHPPLVFWLESLFFRAFGDHFYTEKLYSLCMALLSAAGIAANWRLLFARTESASLGFLPVLLWICIPTVHWSYQNNMLENTLSVLVLWSTWFSIKSIQSDKIEYIFPAAICIWLAFLSKGPVALFPLLTPLFYGIVIKKRRPGGALVSTILLMLFTAATGVLHLSIMPDLNISLSRYLHQQVFPSMQNMREVTTSNPATILLFLLRELGIPAALVLVACLLRFRERIFTDNNRNIFFFLLLTGLSASLPLMVTLKQRSFYLLPSLPYYCMALAVLCAPHVQALLHRRYSVRVTAVLALVSLPILLVVTGTRWGKIGRDQDLVHDIHLVSTYMKPGEIGNLEEGLCSDWSVFAYSMRIGRISWTCGNSDPWYLAEHDTTTHAGRPLSPVNAPFRSLKLYRVEK